MKIVIITAIIPKEKRGLGVVVLNHAKALKENGFEVTIFCRGDKLESVIFEGIRINTFKYDQQSNSILNYILTTRNAKLAWNYFYDNNVIDVVHGHDYVIYKSILKKLKPNTLKVFTVNDPLVYHQNMIKGSDIGLLKRLIFTWIEKNVYLDSDRIHFISEYTFNRFLLKDNNIKSKSLLVECWADYNRFVLPSNKNEVRNSMGVYDEFVIFTLRALEPRMGLDRLIEAFHKFEKQIDCKCRLVIGGKGPMMSELEELKNSLQLTNVELMGYVSDEDAVKWYQSSDVVVVPSLDGEGFGLPIIEAMACGTPALGTPNCAIPEVLSEKQDRLFRDDTIDGIFEGLVQYYGKWLNNLLPKPEEERQYVLDRYCKSKIVDKIINTYTK